MLKVSCNLTDQIQALGSSHSISFRQRSDVLSLSPTKAGGNAAVKAVMSDQNGGLTRIDSGSVSLADRFKLGSLTEDGLFYKEKFIVGSYEVGINKTASLESTANFIQLFVRFEISCSDDNRKHDHNFLKILTDCLYIRFALQEVGCNHTQSLGFSTEGFGTTLVMRKMHLIWVMARIHIEINKYPAWGDVIEIETWFHAEGRIGTRRDYVLKDLATGLVIGRATSKWVMMNQETRRLQKVCDEVRDELQLFCPRELRLAFPEKNNNSLKKIAKLEDPACYSRLRIRPRRADLDMNQHVNNVTYIGWVHESMPQDIIDTHELQAITLDFRRECQQDDIVDTLMSPELILMEWIRKVEWN